MRTRITAWGRERLPLDAVTELVRHKTVPRSPPFVCLLPRRHDAVPVCHAGGDRRVAAVVLPPELERSVRERAVHHDAREVRVADPIDPLVVGQPDGRRRSCPPVQRVVSPRLPPAPRADVDQRHVAAGVDARLRLHRLPAAVERARLLRHARRHRHHGGRAGGGRFPGPVHSRRARCDRRHPDAAVRHARGDSADDRHGARRHAHLAGAEPRHERSSSRRSRSRARRPSRSRLAVRARTS